MEDTLREVVLYQIALRKSLNPCFNGRYSQSVAEFKDWLAANRLNPCFNGRYSQRCNEKFIIRGILTVLILVLMEDTLRGKGVVVSRKNIYGLNPCFNGRYSQSTDNMSTSMVLRSLNPCFNGRYSQSNSYPMDKRIVVSLNPCFNGRYSQSHHARDLLETNSLVLILVLMEDTLREIYPVVLMASHCLNPCFNGRYSQR